MSTYRMIRFLQAHPRIGRFISRGPVRDWISRRVWAEFLSDPEAVARLEQGRRELEAGGGILYEVRDGELHRVNPS